MCGFPTTLFQRILVKKTLQKALCMELETEKQSPPKPLQHAMNHGACAGGPTSQIFRCCEIQTTNKKRKTPRPPKSGKVAYSKRTSLFCWMCLWVRW